MDKIAKLYQRHLYSKKEEINEKNKKKMVKLATKSNNEESIDKDKR